MDLTHTVEVSGSGFVEDEPSRAPRRGREGGADGPGRTRRRRSGRVTIGFGLLIVALVAFGGWGLSTRTHADDVDAFTALSEQITVMDRRITPQRHGEFTPCRDGIDGTITRTYPASRPPTVVEVVAYLGKQGWSEVTAKPSAVATLVTTAAGPEQTVSVFGVDRFGSARSLTATSPGSDLGCFLR